MTFDLPEPKAAVAIGSRMGEPTFLRDAKYWRQSEIAYLRQWHGRLPTKEIANALNRSEFGIEVKTKRLKLTAAVHWDNIWTTTTLGDALAQDRKTVWTMMHEGHYPATTLYWGDQPFYAVYKKRFEQFICDPLNWFVFFDMDRWVDERLCELRDKTAVRWGDRWMTTGEAGLLLAVDNRTVNSWIHRGLLPSSKRFGNWRVLQSEVVALGRAKFGNIPSLNQFP